MLINVATARGSTAVTPAAAPGCRVSEEHDLLALSGQWDRLADQLGCMPFLRPGWIEAWWRAFGRGRLRILTGRRGDTLDALLAVVERNHAVLSPTNHHTPEFGLLHAHGDSRAAVLEELFSSSEPVVSLRYLTDQDGDLEALTASADGAGRRVRIRRLERCLRVPIEGDWDTYQRTLSRNLRQDVRRCWRRLARRGTVSVDVSTSADAVTDAFTIESTGWKGAGKTAMASEARTAQFYSEIADWAATRGTLRLIFLKLDGRAVAFHLALEETRMYLPLKGGFDPAYRVYSPGKLMLHATLRRAFDTGLRSYEFLGGEDRYKLRWATDSRSRFLFQAFTPTIAGRAAEMAFIHGRPLARHALASVSSARR